MLRCESFWLGAIDIIATFGLYLPCCIFCSAQMAELVDALGSGPSSGNGVWVRVPFWAQMERLVERPVFLLALAIIGSRNNLGSRNNFCYMALQTVGTVQNFAKLSKQGYPRSYHPATK